MSDVSTATGTQELLEGAVPSTEPHGVAGEAPVIEAEGQTEETGVASGTLATTADTDAEVYDLEYFDGEVQQPSQIGTHRPFTHIGIDYMGPLHVSNNPAPTDKVWICLMTCFATRAIHLELVTSLSSLEFLQALRRFSARRGPPLSVLVDNGSQFRPVQRAIDQLTEASGEGADSPWRIKWHYTTEYAHWQGGVFERLVGITKQALKKAIGRKRLTFMEMTTLLAETEAIVNTRPLTWVETDPTGSPTQSLTPAHFLSTGLNLQLVPASYDNDVTQSTDSDWLPSPLATSDKLVKQWQTEQDRLDKVWETWNSLYLSSLREQLPLFHNQRQRRVWTRPDVGEVVLVRDEQSPRCQWKMGVVEEEVKSEDGETRAVMLRMPDNKHLKRSVGHLYPLELKPPATTVNEDHARTSDITEDDVTTTDDTERPQQAAVKTKRKAAANAAQKIAEWMQWVRLMTLHCSVRPLK